MTESTREPESQLFGGGVAPVQAPAPSLWEQLAGVFTEPVALFKRLGETPRWGGALGLLLALSIVLVVVWGLKVDVDALMRPILERNPRIPAEQIDRVIELQGRFLIPFGILGSAFGITLNALLCALLFWLVGRGTAEGPRPTYRHALSAMTVSNLVLVPYTLLIGVVCAAGRVGGLTPEKLAPTSVGFFVAPENPKLWALLCQLDLFILGWVAMVYVAARHTLRLKAGGAAACAVIAAVFTVGFKVLLAK